MPQSRMPRFRVVDLLVSMALVALGLGILLGLAKYGSPNVWALLLLVGSGASMGAGLTSLVGKKWMLSGAIAGGFAVIDLQILAALWFLIW